MHFNIRTKIRYNNTQTNQPLSYFSLLNTSLKVAKIAGGLSNTCISVHLIAALWWNTDGHLQLKFATQKKRIQIINKETAEETTKSNIKIFTDIITSYFVSYSCRYKN